MKSKKINFKNETNDLREFISKFLLICILMTTILIGIGVAIKELCFNQASDLSFISQTLLPIWATWVGTILAFYFGKSNFEAAAKSYQEVIKTLSPEEKMASIKAIDVMIPFKDILYMDYEDSLSKTLVAFLQDDKFKNVNRFAFIDDKNILKYIIHRSEFTKYLTGKAISTTKIEDISFEFFLQESKQKQNNYVLNNSAFIPLTATLLEAKKAMDTLKECQDVFVTSTGKESEPVLGLITNNTILEYAK